jgi:protein-disulfide isomerase
VRRIALAAGADGKQLDADLASHSAEIDAILKRTDKQATAMGFAGTPVFLIGPFLVAAALDLPGFQEAVSNGRERQKP